jgi:hypothetical protein
MATIKVTIRSFYAGYEDLGFALDWITCSQYCKFGKICHAFILYDKFRMLCPSSFKKYVSNFTVLGIRNDYTQNNN